MIIIQFFSNFIYKGIRCGYSFELHRQVDAIHMSTHNICLYKEVKKNYIGCNLKTTEFLDCALIRVCAVIRSNTVVCTHSSLVIYRYMIAALLTEVTRGSTIADNLYRFCYYQPLICFY